MQEIGISEISEMPVSRVHYMAKAQDFLETDSEDIDFYGQSDNLRVIAGPDTEKWEDILLSGSFADDIFLLDELFSKNSYDVEAHVSRPAFRQVEYENFPRPEPLGLMIDEDYEEFIEEVSHPFFHGMERDSLRSPKGSNIEVGFGGYNMSEPVDLGLDYLEVRVPSFIAYNESVINVFAEDYVEFDEEVVYEDLP